MKPPRPLSLEEYKKTRKRLRNVAREFKQKQTPLDKFALFVVRRVGNMGFFLIIAGWTALWLGWNLLAPLEYRFDPPMGFVFWLFISNLLQLMLLPLIMVGQNVESRHAEARAEHDLEVNVKAEEEIEIVLEHLEYQNTLLIAMLEKMGGNVEALTKKP